MAIISHDRAFLDQLCTKIVETDMGVSRTYEGNYSQYILAKAAWIETQNAALGEATEGNRADKRLDTHVGCWS
ncbi:hypothetical protein ACFX2K_000233 [Malus domestica]